MRAASSSPERCRPTACRPTSPDSAAASSLPAPVRMPAPKYPSRSQPRANPGVFDSGPSSGAVELGEAIFIQSLTAREDVMTPKSFSLLASVIFTIIGLLQLTRALAGWEITVG